MSTSRAQFLAHGHKLANSNWTAWYCAYQYASEFHKDVLPMIDKGCNYAEKQKPVPMKYLKVAEALYQTALKE